MAIEITDDLVKQIARLSRLAISDEEGVGLQSHFEKILSFIAEFQALDTTGIDPSIFSGDASNVFREDEPRASLPREDALSNAPQSDGTYFVVPRIVGGADEDDVGGAA
jgi:aspartyl-tRNA(Asn)/glutamyl-tRNA(Gln) amidotransferase subunit C